MAAYTAVLAADTAVPAWHDARRELPFVFTGSAITAASGFALIASPVTENGPARAAALFGTALDNAAAQAMRHRLGMVAEVYRDGKAAGLLHTAEVLSALGAAGATLQGHRRTPAALAGLALLTASGCTRLAVFHAGIASAEDPKYVVVPQRDRLKARENSES